MDRGKDDAFNQILKNQTLIEVSKDITSNEKLGVCQEYDRTKYDNVYKRKKFKEEHFGDNKTSKDYITGETLHIDTNASINKYGKKHYSKHTADTDHIVPEKKVHEKLKNNPFLSNQDVRNIANDKSNYRVTQSSLNRSKSDSSNFEHAITSDLDAAGKAKLVGDQIKAETSIVINSTVRTTVNIGNEFKSGAIHSLEAAAIPIMVEGVHNIILVANGEKEFEQAAKDMGKLTASVAATGGGIQVTTTALTNVMKNSSSKTLSNIANSNQVTQIITVALIVKDSVIKYVNGEIDGEQFFCEIGEKGVGLVSGAIGFEVGKDLGLATGAVIGQVLIPIPGAGAVVGAIVGAAIGAFVGSMIISLACTEVYKQAIRLKDSYKSIDKYKARIARLNTLANEALAEMEYQRDTLKSLMDEKFTKWDEEFNVGFDMIFKSAFTDDHDGIAEGVNKVLNVLGENVRFKTLEEFDEFFMDENATFTF